MKLPCMVLLTVVAGCAPEQSSIAGPAPEVVPPPCAEPAPLLGHFNPQVGGYIVMYRAGTDGQQETDRLVAKFQFTPRFVSTHGTQGFSALLEPVVLAGVRCEPSVSFTEYNAAVTVVGT